MALSLRDMVVGTVVDHAHDERESDHRLRTLSLRRRGIIVRVEGDGGPTSNEGAVNAIWVQFKPEAEPERIEAKFLDRFMSADDPKARKEFRRLKGENKIVGVVLEQKPEAVKVVTEDALMLTPKPTKKVVHDRRTGDEEEEQEARENTVLKAEDAPVPKKPEAAAKK